MEARELRIGNYVLFQDDSKLFSVTEICETGIGVNSFDEETWIELDMFYGINLTEEWLSNFGFEKGSDISGECYFKEHPEPEFAIHLYDGIFVWLANDLHITHVHQLQNLFWIITGEELTLKTE